MKKVCITIFLLFIIFPVYGITLPIKSDKVLLVNLDDDTIIYEKNAYDKTSIASLTKIVTAMTVIDNMDDLNKEIIIKQNMLNNLNGYSKVGLKVNDKVTIEELLYALLLPSAGDAAQTLAISTSGSIDEFVKLMNEEANIIGVKNTKFANPVGRDDDNNYSTAYDISVILKYALNNKTFKKIYETNNYHINSLNIDIEKTTLTVANLNNIDIDIIKGSKTGYTDNAGRCLTSTATIDNLDFLLINLNAPTDTFDYITDAINIYDYFDNNYSYKTLINKNDLLYKIDIKNSFKKQYEIKSNKDIKLYVNDNIDLNKLDIEYKGINEITNDISINDKLGIIEYKYNDELIYSYDVYLNENIIYYNPLIIYGIIIFISLILILIIKKRYGSSR